MKRIPAFPPAARRKAAIFAAILLMLAAVAVGHYVRFDIKGHFDGLFILAGRDGGRYEIKDDLYVGDGERLKWGMDFGDVRLNISRLVTRTEPARPYLYSEWDATDGSGFVRNFLPGGRELFTSFGRFMDDDGRYVHGLFVGGGLAASILGNDNAFMNSTGMSWFDGARWYHIWCNVNEGLIAGKSGEPVPPSRWRFLGSRFINKSERSLVLASSHEATIDETPLQVDRYVYMAAGDTFFVLTIRITNLGAAPASFYYVYGDEPWVGNYGSSRGNVGWTRDGIIQYETTIDSRRLSYAGMVDYGNEAAGEAHDRTLTANFIEWFGDDRPEVYFANDSTGVTPGDRKIPLSSETRFIGLQWGPRQLQPHEAATYVIAVGMAGHDPATGFPTVPLIRLESGAVNGAAGSPQLGSGIMFHPAG